MKYRRLKVTYNERDGQSAGFGVVIQDINATGPVTFDKIMDLKNYHKMVPHVKGVDVYENETYKNVRKAFYFLIFDINQVHTHLYFAAL